MYVHTYSQEEGRFVCIYIKMCTYACTYACTHHRSCVPTQEPAIRLPTSSFFVHFAMGCVFTGIIVDHPFFY